MVVSLDRVALVGEAKSRLSTFSSPSPRQFWGFLYEATFFRWVLGRSTQTNVKRSTKKKSKITHAKPSRRPMPGCSLPVAASVVRGARCGQARPREALRAPADREGQLRRLQARRQLGAAPRKLLAARLLSWRPRAVRMERAATGMAGRRTCIIDDHGTREGSRLGPVACVCASVPR